MGPPREQLHESHARLHQAPHRSFGSPDCFCWLVQVGQRVEGLPPQRANERRRQAMPTIRTTPIAQAETTSQTGMDARQVRSRGPRLRYLVHSHATARRRIGPCSPNSSRSGNDTPRSQCSPRGSRLDLIPLFTLERPGPADGAGKNLRNQPDEEEPTLRNSPENIVARYTTRFRFVGSAGV
jgi:hypothetical protein